MYNGSAKRSLRSVEALACVVLVLSLPAAAAGQTQRPVDGNGVPEGWMLIEGDILVRADVGQTASAYTTILWGDGIVPYEFDNDGDDSVSSADRQVMLNAMGRWADVADITFRPRELLDTGWLHIRDSSNDASPSNSSPVGAGVGERTVNITSWNIWTCAHELGHSLGLWHEQSRPDRDNYVQIHLDRVQDGKEHNFDLHWTADIYPPDEYDFDSIMHYGQCEFSCCNADTDPCCTEPCSCAGDLSNCRTITVLPPWDTDWQHDIGQRSHLSHFDALTMSFIYPEDDWRIVDKDYGGFFENGTLWEPYKTFTKGVEEVPTDGTLWFQPGSYTTGGLISKVMTLQAPLGGVVLRP
jgi:hypothetical protein